MTVSDIILEVRRSAHAADGQAPELRTRRRRRSTARNAEHKPPAVALCRSENLYHEHVSPNRRAIHGLRTPCGMVNFICLLFNGTCRQCFHAKRDHCEEKGTTSQVQFEIFDSRLL